MLLDEVFTGFRQTIVNSTVPLSNLSNGTTNVFFKIIGDQGAATDYQSVSYLYLKYPRTTNTTASFITWEILNAGAQAKSRIDINGANLINPSAYVTGGNVPRKIPFVENGGVWQGRSEEHTSELQSRPHLVCRLLLEKK